MNGSATDRFPVLRAASIKIAVLCFDALCSLVEVCRRFRGATCPDDGGSFYKITRSNNSEENQLQIQNLFLGWKSSLVPLAQCNSYPLRTTERVQTALIVGWSSKLIIYLAECVIFKTT
jgi:hypothetical protein